MCRLIALLGITLAVMVLPTPTVWAQSATAFLTADPEEFGQSQSIDLNASFSAWMPEY